MQFNLEKTLIKTIPFRNNSELKIQVGFLKHNDLNYFKYTRPLNMIESKYVLTLHYCQDTQHTPYVFQLSYIRQSNSFDIRAMNQDAQDIEKLAGTPKYSELMDAVHCVIQEDINHENS